MEARKAMIVWQPVEAESMEGLWEGRGRLVSNPRGRSPEVRVFDYEDDAAQDRYDHLPCSLGACLAGWCAENPLADVFRVFLSVVSDGVPMADIHREFLKIDEYAAMVGHTDYFGVEIPDEDEE